MRIVIEIRLDIVYNSFEIDRELETINDYLLIILYHITIPISTCATHSTYITSCASF